MVLLGRQRLGVPGPHPARQTPQGVIEEPCRVPIGLGVRAEQAERHVVAGGRLQHAVPRERSLGDRKRMGLRVEVDLAHVAEGIHVADAIAERIVGVPLAVPPAVVMGAEPLTHPGEVSQTHFPQRQAHVRLAVIEALLLAKQRALAPFDRLGQRHHQPACGIDEIASSA